MVSDEYISFIKERTLSALRSLPLNSYREHGFLRDRNSYFLNISYPSLQAMKPIDPECVKSIYRCHAGPRPIALYIHIPFCTGLCHYCHYYKVIGKFDAINQYLQAVSEELSRYRAFSDGLIARSIYVGGGTPSVLNCDQIQTLFSAIRKSVAISENAEVSFEVHPEHAKVELFRCLQEIGVNRINIGVESFDNKILQSENRRHTPEQATDAIRLAQSIGFSNINIDLIYGLRHQTIDSWIRSVAHATGLNPASVCAYYLRVKETTPLYKAFLAKKNEFPPEEESLLMHISTLEHMDFCNYEQLIVDWFFRDKSYFHSYQMSNWQTTDETALLGIGASAYSYVDGVQYYNVNDLKEYLARIERSDSPIIKGEVLSTEEEKARRALMLGLKCMVDRRSFENRYGIDIVEYFGKEFELLQNLKLIDIRDDSVKLSRTGTLFADEIGRLFYSESIRKRMESVPPTIISTTLPKKNPFAPTGSEGARVEPKAQSIES